MMVAEGTLFRVLLILLVLSNPSCFKAVPVTRTESLMQGSLIHLIDLENKLKEMNERNLVWEEASSNERMDLELQDYAPPGANGHHTPRAP